MRWIVAVASIVAGCANSQTNDPPVDALDVGEAAQTWWTYVGLMWATKLDPGSHMLRMEARNSSTAGDCGVNGDGLPYGRMRMLVRVL